MENKNSSLFLVSPLLARIPSVLHGFGTKYFTPEDIGRVEFLKKFFPVDMKQNHSDIVHLIQQAPALSLEGDALITSQANFLLIIKTADCLPVLIADPKKKVVGAVHCGWRGTASRLLAKVIASFGSAFDSKPQEILVAFGPSIASSCYEVGEDVYAVFCRAGFSEREGIFRVHPEKKGYFFLDLSLANRRQLLSLGVRPENIEEIQICPHCHRDFTSWRRDREKAGRLINFIGLDSSG
ncbi:MAG: peptidoglycan editing factor PgeF [Candidatus Aminicenantales bacterium]